MEERVHDALKDAENPLSWDEMCEAVLTADDQKERLDDVLSGLQEDGTVMFHGRKAGYYLVKDCGS